MRENHISGFEFAEPLPARRAAARATGDLPVVASTDSRTDPGARAGARYCVDSAIARLASTVVKVRDLGGRLRDIDEMRRRLETARDRTSFRVAVAELETEAAREAGRDFCEARNRHEADRLREDAAETDALIHELEIVAQTLEVERRELALQLIACSTVTETLPAEADRYRARRVVDDALRRLGVARPPGGQTLTRGDTKQYGHAR